MGLLVGGGSAGGNLAASVALRARDDSFFSNTPLTGQFLQVPGLLHPKATVPEEYGSISLSPDFDLWAASRRLSSQLKFRIDDPSVPFLHNQGLEIAAGNSTTSSCHTKNILLLSYLIFLDYLKVPDPNDPLYSLILAPTHAGLAPAYFQVAEVDPLRDEGILYEKLLREAGVKTKFDL